MIRLLLCPLLVVVSLRTLAQTDSLTIQDTIGVFTQRSALQTGYGYRYYGASQLAGSQLTAVLNRSPDVFARRLAGQSRRLSWVSTGLVVSSLGFLISSVTTVGRRAGPNGTLTLVGYGALFGSIIPQSVSTQRLAQAVTLHNTRLRASPDAYLPPVIYGPKQPWALSLADTIAMRRVGLSYRYLYRGVSVYPGGQLGRLTASLNDHDVNEGIRYVRTMSRIGRIVGGIGQGLLTGYATSLLLTRRYRRNASVDNELLTTSLLCIGADFVLTRHINRAQRRWLVRYNDLVRQQFTAP